MTDAHLLLRPGRARFLVIATLAAVGALLVEPAIGTSPSVMSETRHPGSWIAVACATALISVLHALWCSRAASAAGALGRSLGAGLVLGIVNSGLSLAAVVAVTSPLASRGIIESFFLGSLFGSLLGGFWGLLFGLGYAPLIALAATHRRRPTAEDADIALLACGVTLLAAAGLRHGVLGGPIWAPALAAVVGAAGLACGGVAFLARRAFVRRARAGAAPGWSVLVGPTAPDATGLTPLLRVEAPAAVLCRAQRIGSGAYRAGESWAAVALVPHAPREGPPLSSLP